MTPDPGNQWGMSFRTPVSDRDFSLAYDHSVRRNREGFTRTWYNELLAAPDPRPRCNNHRLDCLQ